MHGEGSDLPAEAQNKAAVMAKPVDPKGVFPQASMVFVVGQEQKKRSTPPPPKKRRNPWGFLASSFVIAWLFSLPLCFFSAYFSFGEGKKKKKNLCEENTLPSSKSTVS